MNNSDRFSILTNRSTDHTRSMNVAFAVTAAKPAIVHHVAGQNRFPFTQYGIGQET